MGIPDGQRTHGGEVGHRLPVGRHRRLCRRPGVGLAKAIVAGRDRKTRRQTFYVILERTWERLVEVVDVESQASLWSREGSKVRQMCVAVQLNVEARRG